MAASKAVQLADYLAMQWVDRKVGSLAVERVVLMADHWVAWLVGKLVVS
jgi:hypothetical protein